MQLSIDIDQNKSSLFLDFLNLLKKDRMINNYTVIDTKKTLSEYEQEVLDDIGHIAEAIKSADEGHGHKTARTVTL
jgi:hypothetical protein